MIHTQLFLETFYTAALGDVSFACELVREGGRCGSVASNARAAGGTRGIGTRKLPVCEGAHEGGAGKMLESDLVDVGAA